MAWSGTIGVSASSRSGPASLVRTTIVTLDREWSAALAEELRDHDMPTLTPASPARWREHFDGAQPNCVIFDLDHGSASDFVGHSRGIQSGYKFI